MVNRSLWQVFLALVLLGNAAVANAGGYRELDWMDLLTPADRQAMEHLPEIDHSVSPERKADRNLTGSSRFTRDIKNEKARKQWEKVLNDTTVRPELNDVKVRIAGFLVPLETNAQNKISEFFLVPYMGACIHVPPPPPNQLIYVKYTKGYAFQPQDIYEGFWVEGTLHTESMHKKIGNAAYTMTTDSIRIYQ